MAIYVAVSLALEPLFNKIEGKKSNKKNIKK